jgi:hypothetical protein
MPAPVRLRPGATSQQFSEGVLRLHEIRETGIVRVRMILFRGRVLSIVILPWPFGSRGINIATIKSLALFSVAYQIIGTGYHLELLFGFRIARISNQDAAFLPACDRLFDIVCLSRRSDAQNFVWTFQWMSAFSE